MNKHVNVYTCCGLTRHWARACCTLKHFVNLYQASIKVESHSIDNADEEASIEINNALVIHMASINEIPLVPIKAKSLDVSNFFEDHDEKANS